MATGRRTTADVLRAGADYLARHGVDSPRATAETLLMRLVETDRAGLYSGRDGLDQRTARLFARSLCARCRGTPVQYLTGEQQFRGLTLAVQPGVLIPRPETELLVDAAVAALPPETSPVVVDVGTGTGAVALAIKHSRPDSRVLATDVSAEATETARGNAGALDLEIEVFDGDLFDPLPVMLRGVVDVVVSNPPYLTEEEYESLPEEVRAEPFDALVGGTEVHRRLVAESPEWLKEGGWLVVEIGAGQGRDVRVLLEEGRFEDVEVIRDLAGRDRIVRGRLARPA
ncbi:MAG: peptide chain release factor N(5)-glutamine methyltransferase [Actinomycetota bacterium]